MTQHIKSRGVMLILSSPSGAGKTTLAKAIISSDSNIRLSVSVTTRAMRPGEVDGKDYFFIDKAKHDEMNAAGLLLESAEVFGNHYGTPKDQTEKILASGCDVLYDVNWEGAVQLMKSAREDVASIFILPPSMAVLESRLKNRASDHEHEIKKRLQEAKNEIQKCVYYDYIVVNDDIERSLSQIRAILTAERLKRSRIAVSELIENLS